MRINMFFATLLVIGMLAVVKAQPLGETLSARASGSVATLLAYKAVQEDLKMIEEEVTKVRDWTEEFRNKAIQIKKDKGVDLAGKFAVGGLPKFTEEEMKNMAAADAEIRKVSYEELGTILKKAQIERLKQIELQEKGVRALTDKEVIAALELTDKQKTSISGLVSEVMKANNEIIKDRIAGGSAGREKIQESQKKIRANLKESYDKAVALLTEEQKKKWKTMTGEPFDLEKIRFQFPKK